MGTHCFGEKKVVNYKLCNVTSTWEAGTLVDFCDIIKIYVIYHIHHI